MASTFSRWQARASVLAIASMGAANIATAQVVTQSERAFASWVAEEGPELASRSVLTVESLHEIRREGVFTVSAPFAILHDREAAHEGGPVFQRKVGLHEYKCNSWKTERRVRAVDYETLDGRIVHSVDKPGPWEEVHDSPRSIDAICTKGQDRPPPGESLDILIRAHLTARDQPGSERVPAYAWSRPPRGNRT